MPARMRVLCAVAWARGRVGEWVRGGEQVCGHACVRVRARTHVRARAGVSGLARVLRGGCGCGRCVPPGAVACGRVQARARAGARALAAVLHSVCLRAVGRHTALPSLVEGAQAGLRLTASAVRESADEELLTHHFRGN